MYDESSVQLPDMSFAMMLLVICIISTLTHFLLFVHLHSMVRYDEASEQLTQMSFSTMLLVICIIPTLLTVRLHNDYPFLAFT
jgi:heme/copper-type cytochrome/quinol oxidase subunit 4